MLWLNNSVSKILIELLKDMIRWPTLTGWPAGSHKHVTPVT